MKLYKYPRTPHLPWSPGRSNDDKVLAGIDHFKGIRLVGTIKMDGENTTLYPDYIHARSLDSGDHESRHWVKAFHASVRHKIPHGWRVCGENMFAKHSIYYEDLASYFYGISVWNEDNICLCWNETEDFFHDIGVSPVIAFAAGSPTEIDEKFHSCFTDKVEGYVIRPLDEFRYEDFDKRVAKWVRAGHVQTEDHWMHKKVVPNKLR